MIQSGFLPVGKDFVFLHLDTREEYALARTERKSGRGYRGFTFHTCPRSRWRRISPGATTINAIAQAEDGSLIDPFGGQLDLRRKVLRHSPAFREIRCVLRVARFAARFHAFTLAPRRWS